MKVGAPEAEAQPEVRPYTAVAGRSSMGRSTIVISCPFCNADVEAYRWSLAGSGKRCTGCRALLGGNGTARATS